MVLARVVLEVTGGVRLVSETEVVYGLDAALPVSYERISGRRTVDIVLTSGEVPHEVAPVHPVHLIIKEIRQILEEGRLLMFSTADPLALSVDI